jgi:hypothetical protein
MYAPAVAPAPIFTSMISVLVIVELVIVNDTAVLAANAELIIVILPQVAFIVTAVDLLVS